CPVPVLPAHLAVDGGCRCQLRLPAVEGLNSFDSILLVDQQLFDCRRRRGAIVMAGLSCGNDQVLDQMRVLKRIQLTTAPAFVKATEPRVQETGVTERASRLVCPGVQFALGAMCLAIGVGALDLDA